MRRGVWLIVLAVVAAVLGVGSARAGGPGTTTTATTTTGTTTTGTTTTTTTPADAALPPSSLPAACVGAGAAALVRPSRPLIALGTPASNLGPSAYPSSGSILTFDSSTTSGSTCKSKEVTLNSVSLFDGVVTATKVQATNGRGTATGLEISGAAVTATAGKTVPVDDWGQLTLGEKIGRLTAPLVLHLLRRYDSLPAGTAVVVAFAASARPTTEPKHQRQAQTKQTQATGSPASRKQSAGRDHTRKHRRQRRKPPPDYPATPSPLKADGGLTDAAQDNPVVSTALQYLGVPYLWGGANPKTGFDCSGLVQYVFAQLGVSLVHYAAAQWHSPGGVWIPPDRLQPGDLVFFTGSDGTRKAPGHVGIYIADGYFIDAPHTGTLVRIDSLNEPKLADGYVGARYIGGASLHRHLHATQPGSRATAIHVGFPQQFTPDPLSQPLGIGAAGTSSARIASRGNWIAAGVVLAGAAAARTARGHWMWAGVSLGGLLLLLLAGGLVAHRRQQ